MTIGVLALQGAFAEHIRMLHELGVPYREIRQLRDFTPDIDGLILPGGESTVIGKLLGELKLLEPLRQAIIDRALPVFGTCAGMILLAGEIAGTGNSIIPAMDIRVKRNAYGRQLGSFSTRSSFAGLDDIPMVFIRAPYIEQAGKDVDILSTVGGNIVAARQGNVLVTSFHPELTDDTRVHEYFLAMTQNSRLVAA